MSAMGEVNWGLFWYLRVPGLASLPPDPVLHVLSGQASCGPASAVWLPAMWLQFPSFWNGYILSASFSGQGLCFVFSLPLSVLSPFLLILIALSFNHHSGPLRRKSAKNLLWVIFDLWPVGTQFKGCSVEQLTGKKYKQWNAAAILFFNALAVPFLLQALKKITFIDGSLYWKFLFNIKGMSRTNVNGSLCPNPRLIHMLRAQFHLNLFSFM